VGGASEVSPIMSVNVNNVVGQQFRYMGAGGIFGLGVDQAGSGISNSGASSNHGSSGGGGGSSSTLIGLYQSLVSVLSSLVSALSSGKH
jgi:hypothetical protein